MTAHNTHDIETLRLPEYLEESLSLFVQFRFVRVLVVDTFRDHSIVGLGNYSNQEVQEEDKVEKLVHEPKNSEHINHALRVAPNFVFTILSHA